VGHTHLPEYGYGFHLIGGGQRGRHNAASKYLVALMATRPAHILVVLEADAKHQPALDRGIWLAERTGATLDLLVCDYDQDLSAGSGQFDSAALESARRRLLASHRHTLDARARPLSARGISVRIDVRWEHPLDAAVLRKAAETGADLVVKSTHYHAGLGRTLFSAADWNLMTRCPVDLWLVKPRPIAQKPTILTAIDPRPNLDGAGPIDERILETGIALERALRGELHVFHGFDISAALAVSAEAFSAPISAPARDLKSALMREHLDAVLGLTDRHGLERERVHVHEGPVRQLLVAWTRGMNVDVLAISAVSRGRRDARCIGSTAERVLDEIPCDLLIVAPPATGSGTVSTT